ncbi:MAG TPA: sugar ABC transporter ATP-binding protein [Phycisphaerae bacterium]|nr:sugar ABC transporter ATP-binding protein [Phycisphaerae bacterium]
MAEQPLLLMRGIDKHFPGVHALDKVDFDVRRGEVHGLMGQNGAGKSTLVKVLTGVHPRDGGTITFEGKAFHASSPADAQRKGISTVYQEVNLVPSLSVAENLFLGRSPRAWFGLHWRQMRRRSRELLSQFDLDIDVDEPLGSYPVAIQQMVAIARAVDIDARLIILDEPTSSLDQHETGVLFDIIGRLKARGIGIIFVTHFLEQVYRVSDRISVLRNGQRVGTFEVARLPKIELVGHMLGKSPAEAAALEAERPPAAELGAEREVVLAVRNLGRRRAIEPFDLEVRRGEVLGLAGLLGSGRTEAARLLFGADRAESGTIMIGTRRAALRSPRRAIALGIALCPEDRQADGLFPEMSVRGNIALVVQRTLSRLGIISRQAHSRIAGEFVRRLDIATPDLERPVKHLSGGNQQKVILARWLACNPRLLILDEPTRGIDVGAKVEVERLIDALSHEGIAIVFISSELEEVVRRSHRILVLRDRQVVGELAGEAINEHTVMDTIAGQRAHDA